MHDLQGPVNGLSRTSVVHILERAEVVQHHYCVRPYKYLEHVGLQCSHVLTHATLLQKGQLPIEKGVLVHVRHTTYNLSTLLLASLHHHKGYLQS